MTFARIGPNILNIDRISWIEIAEGRPTVHLAGGADFRPRTDEEAVALHKAIVDQLPPADRSGFAVFQAWKR